MSRKRRSGCRNGSRRGRDAAVSVGGTREAKDLFGLFDDTLNRLLAVKPERPRHQPEHPVAGLRGRPAGRGFARALGQQVLRRGIVFIDLAIAQVRPSRHVAQTLGLSLHAG